MAHARLGVKARWYCGYCKTVRYQGRFPCRFCCGFTAISDNVVRNVKTANGQPASRSLP